MGKSDNKSDSSLFEKMLLAYLQQMEQYYRQSVLPIVLLIKTPSVYLTEGVEHEVSINNHYIVYHNA